MIAQSLPTTSRPLYTVRAVRAPRRVRGFTLIELVVTLLLIAVIAVSTNSAGDRQSARDEAAVQSVMANLIWARNTAVTSRRQVMVALDNPAQLTLSICQFAPEAGDLNGCCGETCTAFTFHNMGTLASPSTNVVQWEGGATLSANRAYVVFDTRGQPSYIEYGALYDTPVDITITGAATVGQIRIHAMTGHVTRL